MWLQREFNLQERPRGFHLVTSEVVRALPELEHYQVGLLTLFIKHTSASLTLNENADPTVRQDLEEYFSRLAPENEPWVRHCDEGPDDLPAHLKASLLGSSLSVPISSGRLNLGTWQGVYLCEHRNRGGGRTLVATIQGKMASAPVGGYR